MSLLLQALKQIESKSPGTRVPGSQHTDGCDRSAYTISSLEREQQPNHAGGVSSPAAGQFAELPPMVVLPNHEAATPNTLSGSSYQLYRRYDESETSSEIAVADSVELGALRSTPPDTERPVLRPNWTAHRQLRQNSDQIVSLLPDESRSVIAIVSVEGIEVTAVVLNVCESLAARGVGNVLAIADFDAADLEPDGNPPTLADLVNGTADVKHALVTDSDGAIKLLALGDRRTFASVSKRRLLKTWEDFGARYAFIVVDASARESGGMTALLATCDATFIALRLNDSHRRDAERLVETIRMQGCQPSGCLVVDRG